MKRGRMMKKLLLGSTALVVGGLMAAPAMAADPIKIGVGGYYQFYAIGGGIDATYAMNGSVTQYKGVQFIQEGEIHFIGQTKLDNGTTVGIRVELEGWNPVTAAAPAITRSTKPSCSPSATGAASNSARTTKRRTICTTARRRPCSASASFSTTPTGVTAPTPATTRPTPTHHGEQIGALPGREPHQLLHAALRRPADRCRLRAEDQP